ncbi:MAG TPA: ergothioneine biosynthesis glutamate--cysteine ligase EgtA [Trebonia sp.]
MVVVRGVEQAAAHVHGICLKTGPPRKAGVELEWLVRDARDPALAVPAARIAQAVAPFASSQPRRPASTEPGNDLPTSTAPGILPSGAFLTAEPGGQLELSSLPADSLDDLIQSATTDLTALRAALGGHGLDLAGLGLDPFRPPRRILNLPRYAAMETFFDRGGPWGRQMMGGTASVQVCLDAGDDSDTWTGYRYRWRLLHAIGPLLVATFANSPLRDGNPTGWKSARQQIWANMDAGRTRPPIGEGASDPRDGWARYALDAQVMCMRSPGDDWTAPPGLTFRDWIGARDGLRVPDMEDLAYHLSTLFPPVRPRGHFEIRMIDAQPGDGWVVPLAVTHALLADERAADAAMSAAERIWPGPPGAWPADPGEDGSGPNHDDGNPWITAARCGLDDPAIARASRDCLHAARAALTRLNAPPLVTTPVDTFIENYTQRDRCPADDLLEEVT